MTYDQKIKSDSLKSIDFSELQRLLSFLSGSSNNFDSVIWKFSGVEKTTFNFQFIRKLQKDNPNWSLRMKISPEHLAKVLFLYCNEGKLSIYRKSINTILKTIFWLSEMNFLQVSKKDLPNYFEYILMHDINNGRIVKRLEPLGYKYISDGVSIRDWALALKRIHMSWTVFPASLSARTIEQALKDVIPKITDGDLTYRDWKEGGTFNKLTLDYGRYYIEHCATFFNKHNALATALRKTISCAHEISESSGLSSNINTLNSYISPIVNNFLHGRNIEDLPKQYRKGLSIDNLTKIKNETENKFEYFMRIAMAQKTLLSDVEIEKVASKLKFEPEHKDNVLEGLRYIIETWIEQEICTKSISYNSDADPVTQNIFSFLGIDSDICVIHSIIQNRWHKIFDSICTTIPHIKFYKELGLKINKSQGSTYINEFLSKVESSGTTYFVALTGWRESEYGFRLSDITSSFNKDLIDQRYTPIRYSVKWVVPKTNGKTKLNREITSSAKRCALLLSQLVQAGNCHPCLYSTRSKSIKYPERSEGFILRAVGKMWSHYVNNYEPFLELDKLKPINDTPRNIECSDNEADYLNKIPLHEAYRRSRIELQRVSFLLETDLRRNFVWNYISGNLHTEAKTLLDTYLSDNTKQEISNIKFEKEITSNFTRTIVNEILSGTLYPTPHSFRHMWAEAVYRRFDGDAGWMIRSTFKHVSQTMWLDYIRNKDNRRQHDRVKRQVISSLMYNHLLKKGKGYSGGVNKTLRRLFLKTQVKTLNELREYAEDFSDKEIIDIISRPWGYCLMGRRTMNKAKCSDNGIPQIGGALSALCLGCINNLANGGNIEGILLAISNDLNALNTPGIPTAFSQESYKVVSQAYKQLQNLGADNKIIKALQIALDAYKKGITYELK